MYKKDYSNTKLLCVIYIQLNETTACGIRTSTSIEKLWHLPQLNSAHALLQWQNKLPVNVNLNHCVTLLTTTSTFKFLHRTSISNFRLSLRSGSWCNSARTFMIDIVHGFGGLNTCKRSEENSDLYTQNSSGAVTLFHLHLQCLLWTTFTPTNIWHVTSEIHT